MLLGNMLIKDLQMKIRIQPSLHTEYRASHRCLQPLKTDHLDSIPYHQSPSLEKEKGRKFTIIKIKVGNHHFHLFPQCLLTFHNKISIFLSHLPSSLRFFFSTHSKSKFFFFCKGIWYWLLDLV